MSPPRAPGVAVAHAPPPAAMVPPIGSPQRGLRDAGKDPCLAQRLSQQQHAGAERTHQRPPRGRPPHSVVDPATGGGGSQSGIVIRRHAAVARVHGDARRRRLPRLGTAAALRRLRVCRRAVSLCEDAKGGGGGLGVRVGLERGAQGRSCAGRAATKPAQGGQRVRLEYLRMDLSAQVGGCSPVRMEMRSLRSRVSSAAVRRTAPAASRPRPAGRPRAVRGRAAVRARAPDPGSAVPPRPWPPQSRAAALSAVRPRPCWRAPGPKRRGPAAGPAAPWRRAPSRDSAAPAPPRAWPRPRPGRRSFPSPSSSSLWRSRRQPEGGTRPTQTRPGSSRRFQCPPGDTGRWASQPSLGPACRAQFRPQPQPIPAPRTRGRQCTCIVVDQRSK